MIQLSTSWTIRFAIVTMSAPTGPVAPGFPAEAFDQIRTRGSQIRTRRRRRLFATTLTELNAIASAARIGCSERSIIGRKVRP